MTSMPVILNQELIHLLPQRAAYWPAQRMLIIADIHFGKAAAFRAHGIPVPHGTTAQNLAALDALIDQHEVADILFLGDFLHAKTARAPVTLAAIQTWRERHAALRLTLVRGNHDRHAGDPPLAFNMRVVDEPFTLAGLTFCHHPPTVPQPDMYVLAGHLHPVYRLVSGGDAVRLPCFLIDRHSGILPSFGAFTGGFAVRPKLGERIFLTTGSEIHEVPLRF